jgi:hypothetical protein
MRGLSTTLSRLDPRAGAIGGGDLRRQERRLSERLAQALNAASAALFVAGEKRYEDAVLHDESVPAAVRSVRARQAWELVNQARGYTAEALALNPGGLGLLSGDLQRRLHLMDQFLKRTWRTYVSLRMAEDEVLGRDADILKAFAEAVASGIASMKERARASTSGEVEGKAKVGGGANGSHDGQVNR